MSIAAMAWAFKHQINDPTCKFILVAVANYADEDGKCWPSLSRLSADTGYDRSTILRGLKRLEEAGVVSRTPRARGDGSRSSDVIQLLGGQGAAPRGGGTAQHPGGSAPLGVVAERHGGGGGAPPLEPPLNRHSDPLKEDWPSGSFEEFWGLYPNKVGKADARKAFDRARRRGAVGWSEFMAGLRRYVAKTDDRPWCNPATWLNQERWGDQPAPPPGPGGRSRPQQQSFLSEAMGKHGR